MMTSTAYFNHGRWVAECPTGCGDARALYPEGSATPVYVQRCAEGHEFRIDAPPDDVRARIEAALADRPERYRDWLPRGHPWAAQGFPVGQTPEDLIAENGELRARLAAAKQAKQDEIQETFAGSDDIRSVLAALGVQVRSDGTFSGSI